MPTHRPSPWSTRATGGQFTGERNHPSQHGRSTAVDFDRHLDRHPGVDLERTSLGLPEGSTEHDRQQKRKSNRHARKRTGVCMDYVTFRLDARS